MILPPTVPTTGLATGAGAGAAPAPDAGASWLGALAPVDGALLGLAAAAIALGAWLLVRLGRVHRSLEARMAAQEDQQRTIAEVARGTRESVRQLFDEFRQLSSAVGEFCRLAERMEKGRDGDQLLLAKAAQMLRRLQPKLGPSPSLDDLCAALESALRDAGWAALPAEGEGRFAGWHKGDGKLRVEVHVSSSSGGSARTQQATAPPAASPAPPEASRVFAAQPDAQKHVQTALEVGELGFRDDAVSATPARLQHVAPANRSSFAVEPSGTRSEPGPPPALAVDPAPVVGPPEPQVSEPHTISDALDDPLFKRNTWVQPVLELALLWSKRRPDRRAMNDALTPLLNDAAEVRQRFVDNGSNPNPELKQLFKDRVYITVFERLNDLGEPIAGERANKVVDALVSAAGLLGLELVMPAVRGDDSKLFVPAPPDYPVKLRPALRYTDGKVKYADGFRPAPTPNAARA